MSPSALILGGGIAGLTAALHLAEQGHAVTILEQSHRLGGRLLDAPPPLLLDAHHATWALLAHLDCAANLKHLRHSPLEFVQASGARMQFLHLPLPSPLNTLLGTTLFQGLSMRDRWHLLSFLERTWEQDPPLPDDLNLRNADEWLTSIGQSESARRGVWDSLSRVLLGAALPAVSAGLFMRTLRRCFLTGAKPAKLIVPASGYDSWILTPLKTRLDALGVQIRVNSTVTHMTFDRDRVRRVTLADRTELTADAYLSALPRRALTSLLPERVVTHYAYFQQIGRLRDASALTLRLHLAQPGTHTQLVLLEGRTFHWMVRHADQERHENASVVWAVAVDQPDLLDLPDDLLLDRAMADLDAAFPHASTAPRLDSSIDRRRQAHLAVEPGAQPCRPLPSGPFPNFFTAGDWTDTGWPATLESAVLSGRRGADAVMAALRTEAVDRVSAAD